jgi:hypothetical protein
MDEAGKGLEKSSLTATIRNSRLNHTPDKKWNCYNSGINDYDKDFKNLLSDYSKHSISEIFESIDSPVVIDLMAPSGSLANLFSKYKDKKGSGISVSLEDLRTDEEKERDSLLGITQITGDISKPTIWKEIDKALNGRKADLIIERGVGAVSNLPVHETFYGIMLQKMYNTLNENGIMLVQIPFPGKITSTGISLTKWLEFMNKSGIETKFSPEDLAIMIKKGPSSPEAIPFSNELFAYDPQWSY